MNKKVAEGLFACFFLGLLPKTPTLGLKKGRRREVIVKTCQILERSNQLRKVDMAGMARLGRQAIITQIKLLQQGSFMGIICLALPLPRKHKHGEYYYYLCSNKNQKETGLFGVHFSKNND